MRCGLPWTPIGRKGPELGGSRRQGPACRVQFVTGDGNWAALAAQALVIALAYG
jgi:hypothetical protein